MKAATMKLPRMKTRMVWISCYFNHYNAIVIFSKKPTITKAGEGWQNVSYDYYDLIGDKNKYIIAGACGLEEFTDLFPKADIKELIHENGNVISCEPSILVPMKLTAIWDNDKLRNIDFSLDGYQHQT